MINEWDGASVFDEWEDARVDGDDWGECIAIDNDFH